NDYILFIVFSNTIHLFIGFIFWGKHLFYMIKSGEINIYLIRPINPFLFYNFRTLSIPAFLFLVVNIFLIIISLIYTNTNIFNLSFIVVFILLIFLTLILSMFLDSLDFIKLGLSSPFQRIYYRSMEVTRMYPSQFFTTFKYNFLLFLFQGYYLTLVLIPILNGKSIFLFLNELSILIIIILSFSLGTYINWKYGLKYYEAFG
ncbi:MAG: ABC-2 family transporter protein, partial [Nanoarchaeota archaeon]|nr:ABC-2 family transporter protein [Nanoarchaeota archaeon]